MAKRTSTSRRDELPPETGWGVQLGEYPPSPGRVTPYPYSVRGSGSDFRFLGDVPSMVPNISGVLSSYPGMKLSQGCVDEDRTTQGKGGPGQRTIRIGSRIEDPKREGPPAVLPRNGNVLVSTTDENGAR